MRSNLILIGYMGCGKSSVGCRLAQNLELPFLDTDQMIEEKAGLSIKQIFAQQGEEAFRDRETDCLRELLEKKTEGMVISVGGGLPLREINRRLLRELGLVIYLRVKPITVFERLKGDTTRPLLQTENPKERIREMLELREPYYRDAAEVVIEADEKSFEQIIEEIKRVQGKE